MCGSHSAEAVRLERAAAILKPLGTTEKILQCEGHPSLFHTVNHEQVKCDFSPGPLTNDCSREHAGMIAGAKALGADATDYHIPHHHMQSFCEVTFEDICGTQPDQVPWAVDGCSLFTPALPLRACKYLFALC